MPREYLKKSSNLLAWLLIRAASQALLIVLMAKALGASNYGQYIGIIAVASFLTPFAGLGLSNIVLRNSSKDPKNSGYYFTEAFRVWVASSGICVVAAWIIAEALLPEPLPWLAAFIVIAVEVISSSFSELYARHVQAKNKISIFGLVNSGLPLVRLIFIGPIILFYDQFDVVSALLAHAASGIAFTWFLWRFIPRKELKSEPTQPITANSGIPFSLAIFSARMQNEFNKPVLAHIGFDLAGNYSIAQRINEMASIPLSALQEVLWPKLYSHENPLSRLIASGAFMLIIAGMTSGALWLIAPAIPLFLGPDFSATTEVMRGLAWLPILQVLRSLINFQIINKNYLKLLGWTYLIGALTSIAGVYTLVPIYGLIAAISITYATEAVMIVILLTGLYMGKNSE